ncbi:hypothetical protein ON010_g8571 [Phytophthora cinnamomi]|nr:hypothetical protein ON010_g8571 [Phytophthora cinnamomi]
MVTQFSEAECALGACDPSGWHDLMHNPGGICTRMKTFFISQGKLDRVKWMSANCEGGWTEATFEAAMTEAASKGHLELVQFLHEYVNLPATDSAVAAAAENGHLGVVGYLLDVLRESSTATCGRVEFPESNSTVPDERGSSTRSRGVGESAHERPQLSVETSVNPTSDREMRSCPNGADQEDECPICCDDFTDPFTTTCRHTFCSACIFRWLATNNACPACRQTLDILSPVEATGTQMSETVPFQPSLLEEEDDAAVHSSLLYQRSSTESFESASHQLREDAASPRHFSLAELEDEIARVSAAHRTATLITSNYGNARSLGESCLQTSSTADSSSSNESTSWSYEYLDIDRQQMEPYRWPSGGSRERGRHRLPSFDDGDYRDPRVFEPHHWPTPGRQRLPSFDNAPRRWPSSEPPRAPHRWPSPALREECLNEASRHRLGSRSDDAGDACSICYEVPESCMNAVSSLLLHHLSGAVARN